jgi:hypothetical protein
VIALNWCVDVNATTTEGSPQPNPFLNPNPNSKQVDLDDNPLANRHDYSSGEAVIGMRKLVEALKVRSPPLLLLLLEVRVEKSTHLDFRVQGRVRVKIRVRVTQLCAGLA